MDLHSAKNIEDVEDALYHLMYQFRQINQKYGLIVKEEIRNLYKEKKHALKNSKEQMKHIEDKL